MSKVVSLAAKRNKKKYAEEGIDTENLLICFNGYQLAEFINNIFLTQKLPNDVLDENRDLYKVGFFDESTNKIHVLK